MSVILTVIARVRDWQALRVLCYQTLLGRAREAGATHYRIYRNVKDASQMLVVGEFADPEAAGEMGWEAGERLGGLLEADLTDERVWEAIDWDGIG